MSQFITNIIACLSLFLTSNLINAQKVVVNREIETQNDGKMLLGNQLKDQFLRVPYIDWYVEEYNKYILDQKAVHELKKEKIGSYNIIVFMGTWCKDSRTYFPRLMKLLEAVNYPERKLTIIAVNRKKQSPSGDESLYNIHKIPTIILKRYGKESGRIIEIPATGYIERDLVNILKKNNSSVIKEILSKF